MELSELTNSLWEKYREGHFEEVYFKTKKWFNAKAASSINYKSLLFLLAISNMANKSIGARLFWKHFIFGHRYDIYGNKVYKDIRKDFGSRWEELIYDGYDDVQSFWNVFYKELRWKRPYPKQENIWIHAQGHKWSNYLDFIGDNEKARFSEHYRYIQYYIEDFEKDSPYTKQESAIYFAKECLTYHLRSTLDKTIDEFIKEGKIELFKGKWKSEFNLYLEIKDYFKNYNVIYQGSPSFLEGQKFDIWIPELKVAIEYNGLQHYEPVDFFGGIQGFEDTVKRDEIKRQKCSNHNVNMIEVKEGYNLSEVINQIILIADE